ncbi:hypothetical protein [Pseudidiomarina homiensis]|uniref:hypothetical protein n=1 Tax=Pseudidiomarina homiensis TaxID=364198 RepID=UPI00215A94C1|nr:hypothetical protein [Pseudidiomarina homiensis]
MRTLMAISAVALALTTSTVAHADEKQRNELRKQLEIMNSIFSTALEQESKSDQRHVISRDRLSYNYLAGQGVVYRTRIGGNRIMFFGGEVPIPPMPDMPHIEGIDSVEIELAVTEGLAAASEALEGLEIVTEDIEGDGEGNIRIIRTVTDEVRESAGDMRELRRRVRDLELAKRSAEGAESEAIEKELAQARVELEETQQALETARAEIAEARQQVRKKVEVRKAERAELLQKQLASFEQTMASTLCDYGRTLRALPASENVTFVLEGAGQAEQGGDDKIYIFSKGQLDKCESPSDLLTKATTYNF